MTILCSITGVSETTAQVIIAKLEAESTAYVICQALGLDTSDYSFGYVARAWAGGGEQAIAGIKGSCENIQKAAASVLQSFEVEQEQAA